MSQERHLPTFIRTITPEPFQREEMLMARHEDDDGNPYYIRADMDDLRAVLEALSTDERSALLRSLYNATELEQDRDALREKVRVLEAELAGANRVKDALDAHSGRLNEACLKYEEALRSINRACQTTQWSLKAFQEQVLRLAHKAMPTPDPQPEKAEPSRTICVHGKPDNWLCESCAEASEQPDIVDDLVHRVSILPGADRYRAMSNIIESALMDFVQNEINAAFKRGLRRCR